MGAERAVEVFPDDDRRDRQGGQLAPHQEIGVVALEAGHGARGAPARVLRVRLDHIGARERCPPELQVDARAELVAEGAVVQVAAVCGRADALVVEVQGPSPVAAHARELGREQEVAVPQLSGAWLAQNATFSPIARAFARYFSRVSGSAPSAARISAMPP